MKRDGSSRSTEAHGARVPRVAVIGAGIAGAACACALSGIGFEVTVFDKSRGVAGRMATRRISWIDAEGAAHDDAFDHGCGQFRVTRPRFRVVVERAVKLGFAAHWSQHVHARGPAARLRQVVVPTPNMPALCQHLLGDATLRLGHLVSGLQRVAEGWLLRVSHDRAKESWAGPFDQVVVAIPPAQAAPLLKPHRPDWANALAAVRATPCWTLMAVTNDVDWPWDAALVERGPLARIARNDRKPGRQSAGGRVPWVAQATPAWSTAHLDDEPSEVIDLLRSALAKQLSSTGSLTWHHCSVHRWLYARNGPIASDGGDCFWDQPLGLGVCNDAFGDGNVEAGWHSGDELADAIAAAFEAAPRTTAAPEPSADIVPARDVACAVP
jgi:predicted NAD/FAD-dependent oxidoreductase